MAVAFSRILLAYDDSAGSKAALEYACAVARHGALLTVAHAVDEHGIVASAMSAGGFAAIDPTPIIAAVDDQGNALLKNAIDACATHGVAAKSIFLHDSIKNGLIEYGRTNGIDLIVLGTHGRQGLSRAVIGSVAEEIMRASIIPVLVVSAHVKAPRYSGVFSRALVALDDSGPSRAALLVAGKLAAAMETRLTLCNVVDSRDVSSKSSVFGYGTVPLAIDARAVSAELLESEAAASDVTDHIDDLVTVQGDPAALIEHTATQRDCDVIVLGSHVRQGLERLLFGSVAEAVVRHSSLPVLVVPTKQRAAHRTVRAAKAAVGAGDGARRA